MVARHDLAGVDADAAGELDAPRPWSSLFSSASARCSSVAVLTARSASSSWATGTPNSHHFVAAEPLDRPVVLLDDLGHRLGVAGHDPACRLGIGRLAERRRSDDVAEEDRYRLPDLEALRTRPGSAAPCAAEQAASAFGVRTGHIPTPLESRALGPCPKRACPGAGTLTGHVRHAREPAPGRARRPRAESRLDEETVTRATREIRLALLEADVDFEVVKQFVTAVRERATGQDVLKGLEPGQQVVKIVHEELTELSEGRDSKLVFGGRPW